MGLFTFVFGSGRGGPERGRHTLAAGRVLRVARGEAGTVYCAKGRLWVTRDGTPEDIVVRAGERCAVATGAVIEALGDAEINLLTDHSRPALNALRSRRPTSPAPRSRPVRDIR
jgi:hypothetical protein